MNAGIIFTDPGVLDKHKAIISWGDGKTDTIDPITSNSKASHTYPRDDGSYNVKVTLVDDDGGDDTASFKVTVTNENPIIATLNDQNISEGNPVFNLNAAFSDPGSLDKHKVTINWGDGETGNIDPATSPIKATHTYKKDNNIYTIFLTLTDDNGGRDTESLKLAVKNEAPIVQAGKDQKVSKGKTITITANFY